MCCYCVSVRLSVRLLEMSFADCCTHELEFRNCTHCQKTFTTKFTSRWKNIDVNYRLLLFFHNNRVLLSFLDVYQIYERSNVEC